MRIPIGPGVLARRGVWLVSPIDGADATVKSDRNGVGTARKSAFALSAPDPFGQNRANYPAAPCAAQNPLVFHRASRPNHAGPGWAETPGHSRSRTDNTHASSHIKP